MADQEVIRIKCPKLSCQRILAVPGTARGKLVRCRACGTTLRVPQKGSDAPPAAQPSQPSPQS